VIPTTAAFALVVPAAFLLPLLPALIRVVPHAGYYPPAVPVMVATGALSLVAAVCLGMAIGHALPHLVTAPILMVIGLFLVDASVAYANYRLVILASPRTPDIYVGDVDFAAVAGQVSAAQAISFVGMAAAGFGWLAATTAQGRIAAAAPLLLAGAIAVPLLPGQATQAVVRDSGALVPVCAQGGAPRVCVSKVHSGQLSEVTPVARQALSLLAQLPNAPTSATELPDTWWDDRAPRTADTLQFRIWIDGHDLLQQPETLLPYLLDGAGTRRCQPPPASARQTEQRRGHLEREQAARRAAAAWLMHQPLVPQPAVLLDQDKPDEQADAQARQVYQQLVAVPEDTQRQRVAALRQAALTCSGDLYAILTGGTP
jgi:hypothetical protein